MHRRRRRRRFSGLAATAAVLFTCLALVTGVVLARMQSGPASAHRAVAADPSAMPRTTATATPLSSSSPNTSPSRSASPHATPRTSPSVTASRTAKQPTTAAQTPGKRTITLINRLNQTIWPAIAADPKHPVEATGWVLRPGASLSFAIPDHWDVRLWARTGCSFDAEVKNDDRRPLPTETFNGRRKEMDIDGVRFVLDYTGDWHQAGNLFIHLPELKLMGAMDSFTPKSAPFFRLYFSAHVPAYFDAMDQLLEYDYETIVTGHMALPGTPEDVATNGEYIRDLRAAASEALRTVDMREASAAAKVPADNKQAEIKVWMDAVTARAAELMPSWEKRLGGTDIFLADNLNATAWSLFID